MTNGSDLIEAAIDEAAQRITAHAAPDLRAQVAARREHPVARLRWWQPALAAAALAVILALWERPAPPADTPRAASVDIALGPDRQEPEDAPVRAMAARTPARRDRIVRRPAPWPEPEHAMEPLALAVLTLDPIHMVEEPLAPVEVAPLVVPPLALHPLDEPDLQRRR